MEWCGHGVVLSLSFQVVHRENKEVLPWDLATALSTALGFSCICKNGTIEGNNATVELHSSSGAIIQELSMNPEPLPKMINSAIEAEGGLSGSVGVDPWLGEFIIYDESMRVLNSIGVPAGFPTSQSSSKRKERKRKEKEFCNEDDGHGGATSAKKPKSCWFCYNHTNVDGDLIESCKCKGRHFTLCLDP